MSSETIKRQPIRSFHRYFNTLGPMKNCNLQSKFCVFKALVGPIDNFQIEALLTLSDIILSYFHLDVRAWVLKGQSTD